MKILNDASGQADGRIQLTQNEICLIVDALSTYPVRDVEEMQNRLEELSVRMWVEGELA
jgi:hypothetical protein